MVEMLKLYSISFLEITSTELKLFICVSLNFESVIVIVSNSFCANNKLEDNDKISKFFLIFCPFLFILNYNCKYNAKFTIFYTYFTL